MTPCKLEYSYGMFREACCRLLAGYKKSKKKSCISSTLKMKEASSSETSVTIHGVSGGIVNILGGGSVDYSE